MNPCRKDHIRLLLLPWGKCRFNTFLESTLTKSTLCVMNFFTCGPNLAPTFDSLLISKSWRMEIKIRSWQESRRKISMFQHNFSVVRTCLLPNNFRILEKKYALNKSQSCQSKNSKNLKLSYWVKCWFVSVDSRKVLNQHFPQR